jgi:hypothetical protein
MLEDIKEDIQRLIAAYEGAKMESMALKSELEQVRMQNDDYRKQIIELERKIDNLELTDAFLGTAEDRSEAKGKIARMIKEIDKCMALISNSR